MKLPEIQYNGREKSQTFPLVLSYLGSKGAEEKPRPPDRQHFEPQYLLVHSKQSKSQSLGKIHT